MTAREVLQGLAGGPLPAWELLEPTVRVRPLRKGEFLFHAGQVQPFVFVVTQGLVKLVYETPDGDSWVKAFVPAGTCFASIMALARDGVTSFSTVALAESRVALLEYQQVQRLAARHIEWQRAISRAFENYGLRKEKREMELLTLTAEERYLRFLEEFQGIASQLSQKDIASYIRITPVALSRIRRRLRAPRLLRAAGSGR